MKTLKLTSCVKVKELVIKNPSFDHLNKIQDLFTKFSAKLFEIQAKLHARIDYFAELNQQKPQLCKQADFVNELASTTQFL